MAGPIANKYPASSYTVCTRWFTPTDNGGVGVFTFPRLVLPQQAVVTGATILCLLPLNSLGGTVELTIGYTGDTAAIPITIDSTTLSANEMIEVPIDVPTLRPQQYGDQQFFAMELYNENATAGAYVFWFNYIVSNFN